MKITTRMAPLPDGSLLRLRGVGQRLELVGQPLG